MTDPHLHFAVIGAGKCGTTTLYQSLRTHPEVFLPTVKETNFFALSGLDLEEGPDPEAFRHWPEAVTDPTAWADLYAAAAPGQQLGEVCPMYLYSPRALENLAAHRPGMRIVVILRDPVERLWSRHLHLVRDGRSPAPFEAVTDPTSVWWRRPDLIAEGRYATHLREVDARFPAEQVRVLFYDDLKRDPDAVFAALGDFLGLSAAPVVPGARHNASGRVRSPRMQQIIGPGGLISRVARALPASVRRAAGLRSTLERLRGANLAPSRCPTELRAALLDRVYRAEIEALEARTGRDLSAWRTAA